MFRKWGNFISNRLPNTKTNFMEITAYILFSKTIVLSHREYTVVWPFVCDSYSANGMS